MAMHLAAINLSKGQPFEIQTRSTPKPGPGELLIAVKSIALNPADSIIRSTGLFIQSYPTVLGFDFSGLVLEVGSAVPAEAINHDGSPMFEVGVTRIAAYAGFFWKGCNPDYGAFQERVVVPWQHAVVLPDEMGWNAAATLPVAVQVPLSAWDTIGIQRLSIVSDEVSKTTSTRRKNEALLIWGASSSVGTMGVQSGRLLREDPNSSVAAVYATSGAANREYVASLGADHVCDYKDPKVVEDLVSRAKKDGLVIKHCFLAMGDLSMCQAVLGAFIDKTGHDEASHSKIASAPPLPTNMEAVTGVEVLFIQPSMDEKESLAQFQYWMGTWLGHALSHVLIRPSPEPKVIGRGLDMINTGIDMLAGGVSCMKLVVEIDD